MVRMETSSVVLDTKYLYDVYEKMVNYSGLKHHELVVPVFVKGLVPHRTPLRRGTDDVWLVDVGRASLSRGLVLPDAARFPQSIRHTALPIAGIRLEAHISLKEKTLKGSPIPPTSKGCGLPWRI